MSDEPIGFPRQLPPMPAIARILSRFDRAQLEGFIAVAIDLADAMDGDPDLEDDDPAEEDDPAGQYDEDAWTSPLSAADTFDLGAGCPIADAGEDADGGGV